MKQRGRKSAASFEVLAVDGSPDRVQPPDHLSPDEQRRFADIAANCSARHFRPSDVPLLSRFCEADALAERAAKELRENPVIDGRPSPWLAVQEKSVRALVSLSVRLRLGPLSRIDAAAIGRQEPRLTVNPWEWSHEDTRKKGGKLD
jgi:phage terminase small subunit